MIHRVAWFVQLLNRIVALNEDASVHGIIVQMPLDSEHPIDPHRVTDAVSPNKDVDGYVQCLFYRSQVTKYVSSTFAFKSQLVWNRYRRCSRFHAN